MDEIHVIASVFVFSYTFGLVIGTILGIELMRDRFQNRRPADA